ncbi:ABC transporter ATP-binding protein [Pajaroellobacter abortibovis]|uniref:ABC transporter ATP-binding protein n=1 Tax=Pajaroellobacter abortibovis TaxID=1882918 RepID=A0A1L6MZC0_9BACT|nr:ABC transporter ATP-binding protein [Pajaroellobacter abortibovis]
MAALIEFKSVKKRFGAKEVYQNLSLCIRKGETFTVLGPSGCGKSVLLKMLIGLVLVDQGALWFDGQDITKLPEHRWIDIRRRIAYLFQSAALFDSLNVKDNVAYGLRELFWKTMSEEEITQRVAESLNLVGLPGIEDMWPSDLSGGMRKRVGLARTLALHPEVILYDEPTTGLDPINTARISYLITKLQASLKLTSIVITHDMKVAFEVSDRLAMLGKGGVHKIGARDDFHHSQDPYVRDFIEGRVPGENGIS